MRAAKVWTVVAGAALMLTAGACGSGAKPVANPGTSKTAVTTTPQAAGASPSTRLSADAAAKLILGINSKLQQAANTPNGPRALTHAEVQAIVDAQNKQLGFTVPPK